MEESDKRQAEFEERARRNREEHEKWVAQNASKSSGSSISTPRITTPAVTGEQLDKARANPGIMRIWRLDNKDKSTFKGKFVSYVGKEARVTFEMENGDRKELNIGELVFDDRTLVMEYQARADRLNIENQKKAQADAIEHRKKENTKENPTPIVSEKEADVAVPDDEFGSAASTGLRSFLYMDSSISDYSDCVARKIGEARNRWELPVKAVTAPKFTGSFPKSIKLDRGSNEKSDRNPNLDPVAADSRIHGRKM